MLPLSFSSTFKVSLHISGSDNAINYMINTHILIKSQILTISLTIIGSVFISCGNKSNPSLTEGYRPNAVTTGDTTSRHRKAMAPMTTNSSKEEVKKAWDDFYRKNGYGNSKQSRAYDAGYDAGFEQGTDDAANGLEWHGMYDDSNRYNGKSKDDYEDGYEYGYKDGYEAEHSGGEPEEW